MSHNWTFDVRNTVRDYTGAENTGVIKMTYDHINAMCFLLDGIPYSVVYGPAQAFAGELLKKLTVGNPGVVTSLFGPSLLSVMQQQLQAVVAIPGSDTVLMRVFYENTVFVDPAAAVLTCFRTMKTADTNAKLCMPFLSLPKPIPPSDMTTHINAIGKYTLFDIYTKSKKHYPDLAQAVVYGKSIGALGSEQSLMTIQSGLEQRTIPGQNNRKCGGSGCVTNQDTWCNIDSNGNCTTAS
jgi:hypothetical protein